MVEWWSAGVVEWWSAGVVEWWSGGVVEWWRWRRGKAEPRPAARLRGKVKFKGERGARERRRIGETENGKRGEEMGSYIRDCQGWASGD